MIDLRGIYTKEKEPEVGKFPLGSQQNLQPLDSYHTVERERQGAVKYNEDAS